ncbi:ABC transporter ATP-binding protein [Streptomyces sp. NPDC088194]|uniref:ABC transporter ATP-binding protein n=1 Tax=Streptomyces sp. NPDC088194 TaxID=3154931 RepID=UPI00344F124A
MRRSTRSSTPVVPAARPDAPTGEAGETRETGEVDETGAPRPFAAAAHADRERADPLEAAPPRGAARRLLRSVLGPGARRLRLAALVVLLQQAAAQAGPVAVAVTIDRAIPALRAGDARPLAAVAAGYAGCVLAAGLLQRTFIRLSVQVGQHAVAELRLRLFAHLQAQSVEFHDTHASGTLASRASSDVEAVRSLFDSGIDQIVTAAVSLVYISSILLVLDWRLGCAAVAAMAPIHWTMRSFRRRSLQVYRRRSGAAAAASADMSESFAGIRTVQAFRLERANERRFGRLNQRHRNENRQAEREMARYVTSSRLVANTAVAGLVLWGGYRVASGAMELGSYAGVVLYLRDLYDKPLRLGGVLDAYQSATASLGKIAVLLSTEPTVAEPARPAPLPAPARQPGGRRVRYDDVTFAYRDGPDVLRGFALDIPAGQTVALIGPSGGGKSTLAGLLARVHDPTGGRVLLDGIDLRSLAASDLRNGVVMVPQEGFLFSGTIAENIAFARPDATFDEIRRAAEAIGAHPFIAALHDGYRTQVGGRGGRLSSGERQLISLARVLLVDPSVIVLDEATSVIDIPSERAVRTAMRAVFQGRTALVIAHRMSTIRIADRVLVLSGGRIVDDRTPAELAAEYGPSPQDLLSGRVAHPANVPTATPRKAVPGSANTDPASGSAPGRSPSDAEVT